MKSKNIQTFEEYNENLNISDVIGRKKSKEPIIEYKEEDGKFYKMNPSGGKWIEITDKEYEYYKKFDKRGKFN